MDGHIHNFSGFWPWLTLPGGSVIPTYFPTVSFAFCICLVWLVRRTEERRLRRNDGLDLALVLMIFGLLGARLFHVIFEAPRYYFEAPFRVFEIWHGGFVWYGGALLGTFGFWLFLKRRHLPVGVWFDVYAPLCALGYAAGRLACVFAGCCYGRVCELFPQAYVFRYPTQIFAVVWELAVLGILVWLEKRRRPQDSPPGQLFRLWVVLHGTGRLIMEIFRGDPRGPNIGGLSLSMSVSLLLIFGVLAFEFRRRGLARRRSRH